MRYTSSIAAVTLVLLSLLCSGCGNSGIQNTGSAAYDIELNAIEQDLAAIPETQITDNRAALRRIYHLYRRAGLTGDFRHFKAVENALDETERKFGLSRQLLLFRADFNFKLHRLARAGQDIAAAEAIAPSTYTKALKADIALQRGEYGTALATYKRLIEEDDDWEHLARLAYYYANTGEAENADGLYRRAQERLSVKQKRHYAWLELQRGIIDLEHHRHSEALAHYLRAEYVYSGYWLIREHIAEVYHRLGRTAEAIDLYEHVVEHTGHPEFAGALASILGKINPRRAAMLYERADTLFQQRYVLYPEAALGHYIEYLLEREALHPELVDYAERNHAPRPNAQSKLLLVQAQLKAGRKEAARETLRLILQTPWRTPEIKALADELGLLE